MQFSVDVTELKRILKTVQALSEISASRTSSHTVCQLRANTEDKSLILDFSLNGSFLSYPFSEFEIESEGDGIEIKRSVDLSVLTELKLSEKRLSITLGTDSKDNSTIKFACGRQSGTVLVSNSEQTKGIEFDRSSLDDVELNYHFKIADFLDALNYHTYGEHNDIGAAKRLLRIISTGDGQTTFMSQDSIAGSLLIKDTPLNRQPLDEYVVPGPLVKLLSTLKSKTIDEVFLGVSQRYWRIQYGNLEVWYNIVPMAKTPIDLRPFIQQVKEKPRFQLDVIPKAFIEALSEISPFLSSQSLMSKEDMPILRFEIDAERKVKLSVSTFKTRNAEVVLEGATLSATDSLQLPKSEEFYLNFKFVQEFCSSLRNNHGKADDTPMQIIWWPYNVKGYPMMGKGVVMAIKDHYYMLSRANYKKLSGKDL